MATNLKHTVKRSLLLKRYAGDEGVALPLVLIVFVVGIALVGAFLVAIVGSSNVTSSSKSIVEAEAAAEAGLAAAEAALLSNPCEVQLSSIETPDLVADGYTYEYPTETADCTDDTVTVTAIGKHADAVATVQATYELETYGTTPPRRGANIMYLGGQGFGTDTESIRLIDTEGDAIFDMRPNAFSTTGTNWQMFTCKFKDGIIPGPLRLDVPLRLGPGTLKVSGVSRAEDSAQVCNIQSDLFLGVSAEVDPNYTLNVAGSIYASLDADPAYSKNAIPGQKVPADGTMIIRGSVGESVFSNYPVTSYSSVEGDVRVSSTSGTTVIHGVVKGNVYSNGNVRIAAGGVVQGNVLVRGELQLDSGTLNSTSTSGNRRGVVLPGAVVAGNVVAGGAVAVGSAVHAQNGWANSTNRNNNLTQAANIGGDVSSRISVTVLNLGGSVPAQTHISGLIAGVTKSLGTVNFGVGVEIRQKVYALGKVDMRGTNNYPSTLSGCIVHGSPVAWVGQTNTSAFCAPNQALTGVAMPAVVAPVEGFTIKPWVDYSHTAADVKMLTETLGFQVKNYSGQCAPFNNRTQFENLLNSVEANTIFDLRSCTSSGPVNGNRANVALKHDVVFLVPGAVNFTNITFSKHREATANPQISVIHPVTVQNRTNPNYCNNGDKDIDFKNVKTSEDVLTLVYTPCELDFDSGSEIYGSVYAGRIEGGSATTITFRNVTLPTWYDSSVVVPGRPTTGIGNGGNTVVTGTGLGGMRSQRDVTLDSVG